MHAGSWYLIEDLYKVIAEDLEEGVDTPTSDCYTINGQPGDFGLCSNGILSFCRSICTCLYVRESECGKYGFHMQMN